MASKRGRQNSQYPRIVAAALFCVIAAAVWHAMPREVVLGQPVEDPETPIVFVDSEAGEAQNFARFDHRSAQHARMPCLLCHKRSAGLTRPKMPGHQPCSGCHVQQFADNQSAICTICHTATSVKAFPPLRSFGVTFNHGMHVRQTGCVTCHKPMRGGAALSLPAGGNAHASCFQCHGPQTEIRGRNIGSCGTCHAPGRLVPVAANSKAYSSNFSHREHTAKGLACSACHAVQAGSRRGSQVTAPAAAMHFPPKGRTSCATCHNDKRAFGPPDFKDCKRCHEGNTFRF